MKHIDEERLENDLIYRFGYLVEFIGFSSEDIEVIHSSGNFLAPLLPGLVEAV